MSSPLERVAAALRGALDKALRVLKIRKHPPRQAAPEPFNSIEDSSASFDGLLEPNAAMARPAEGKAARGKALLSEIDLRERLSALGRKKALLACVAAVLLFLLALLVTAIVVRAPARPLPPPAGATSEGAALVRRLIIPPRSSLAPRMEMERQGAAVYTVDDAVELGVGGGGMNLQSLSARNDDEADALYGTVR